MKVRAYIETTYELDTSDPRLLEAYGARSTNASEAKLEVLNGEQHLLETEGDYLISMIADSDTEVRLVALSIVEDHPRQGAA